MNCREHRRRETIVRNYIVAPVAHIQLLNGQTKHSDANTEIQNDYYLFSVTNRTDGRVIDTIQCGMGAARDFLRLLEHPGLPVFNPLHGVGGAGGGGPHGGNPGEPGDNRLQAARQLYNACMWIFIIKENIIPRSPIYNIRQELDDFINNPPANDAAFHNTLNSLIKGTNTVMKGLFHGQTLTDKINELRRDNRIRDNMCQFNLLQEALDNMNTEGDGIVSYF